MRELIVYGLGELGQLYGAAALRAGLRVTPIVRSSDPAAVLREFSEDVPLLVAVSEVALDEVLAALPKSRARALILLQNELFPSEWERHGLAPTVVVPWLLKKRGTPLLVARPTPSYGPHAELMRELHAALQLPAVTLPSMAALHQALVEKYAFIIAINALGMLRDRTLALWLQEDPLRVRALGAEAARLGAALCASEVDLQACERALEEAMRALGPITARGRSAAARVARAAAHARRLGLTLPEIEKVLQTTESR